MAAAARFAIGCGLHQITPEHALDSALLGAPEDFVELGDRIYMFWFLFIVDRVGSLWYGLPQSFANEVRRPRMNHRLIVTLNLDHFYRRLRRLGLVPRTIMRRCAFSAKYP